MSRIPLEAVDDLAAAAIAFLRLDRKRRCSCLAGLDRRACAATMTLRRPATARDGGSPHLSPRKPLDGLAERGLAERTRARWLDEAVRQMRCVIARLTAQSARLLMPLTASPGYGSGVRASDYTITALLLLTLLLRGICGASFLRSRCRITAML